MNINYGWIGLFIAVILLLVVWLVKRNRKDEKTFEEEIIQSELKPEEDKDHDEKSPDTL